MQDLNLQGKNVAVFGLGDSISYAENYADGTGELHDVFQNLGCNMLGYVSQEGYEYEASKAIRDGLFCGLPLDNVNFEELTKERVTNWVAKLKDEGIAAVSSDTETAAVETVAVEVAVVEPTVPSSSAADSDATAAIIAQLEKENTALRHKLEESSSLLADDKSESVGFTPHYNASTGRTMWTSSDGRTCFYTEA
jgi:hypothetical protein